MSEAHALVDVRPVVVGYVTALWQGQDDIAEAIVRDLQLATTERGESAYDITLDVLDCMADMVLTILAATARSLGLEREALIGSTLRGFGRIVDQEPT